MRAIRKAVVIIALLGLAPMMAACADFDMDKLDVFGWGEKKKIPGERKPLFPEGVPGVTQGIPPELLKGNQPPAESAELQPEAPKPEVAEKPKPKPKPKPRVVRARPPKPQPAQVTVQPGTQGQSASQANWPAPGQSQPAQTGTQAPWPSTAQQPSPWPESPAPGTFQR